MPLIQPVNADDEIQMLRCPQAVIASRTIAALSCRRGLMCGQGLCCCSLGAAQALACVSCKLAVPLVGDG